MSEQESKLYALYQAVHLMMARLGADGEIDTRAPEVDAVMDAMHEYDGGQYIQWNAPTHPQPVTPAGGEVEPVRWQYRYQYRDPLGWSDWLDVSPKLKADMDAIVAMFASNGVPVETRQRYTHPPIADGALVRDALVQARDWFESQAKATSKGCGSTWDLLQVREQRDLADAALNPRGSGCG